MSFEYILHTYLVPWGINIAISIAIFIVGKYVISLIDKIVQKMFKKSKMDPTLSSFLATIIRAVLTTLLIIAILDRLGVNTTSFVAILGAAGIAIGFALKDSLNNFASGTMLIIFSPFKNGDYVEVAGVAGVVEGISIFTTVLKTPDNKKIIVPNGLIYSSKIINYSAFENRRVDMVFGIGYQDDIPKAKEIIKKVLDGNSKILKDPAADIFVGELADSSVNFLVRPWAKGADYWAVKFEVTEKIKLEFDKNGISIPFPQMDIHLDKLN